MKQAIVIFLNTGNIVIAGDNLLKVFSSVSQAVDYCRINNINARMI